MQIQINSGIWQTLKVFFYKKVIKIYALYPFIYRVYNVYERYSVSYRGDALNLLILLLYNNMLKKVVLLMIFKDSLYLCSRFWSITPGEMAEWSNAVVLKTIVPTRYRGFESLSLRKTKRAISDMIALFINRCLILKQLLPPWVLSKKILDTVQKSVSES